MGIRNFVDIRFVKLAFACVLVLFSIVAEAQQLAVMSYNLRLDTPNDGDNAWPNRREAVAEQIAFYAPDVLGVQEAKPSQVDFLNEQLRDYASVGEPRRPGDEASSIFYRRDRFDLIQTSTFWLSPTPDTISIAWGANYPRIATYAQLRERSSGKEFFFVNTHLDHEAQEARERGLALIAEVVDAIARPNQAVILTGDFNAEPTNNAIRQLSDSYLDAYDAVEGAHTGPCGTFSGFDACSAPERRIDYIMVRRGNRTRVDRFATLISRRGDAYLSDHLPVMAHLELSPKPIVIGHRGARGHATENSLPSVQAALDLGVDMMEIDVFRLADGEIVVFHDATLDRLTDSTGEIEKLNFEEVNGLLLDGAHRIPRLRDVLTLIDHRARLNVELKGANTADGTYAVLEEFVEEGGYRWEDFAISSFRHDELRRMRELHPDIAIGILPTGGLESTLAVAKEVGARSINPHHVSLTQQSVNAMHAAGFRVYPWTVNAHADIARMTALGVDGIITDYPDRAAR